MEGPQPGGHRAQPDCRKRCRHIIKSTLRRDGLNDRLIVRPSSLISPIAREYLRASAVASALLFTLASEPDAAENRSQYNETTPLQPKACL
jgi:hypothetical protein